MVRKVTNGIVWDRDLLPEKAQKWDRDLLKELRRGNIAKELQRWNRGSTGRVTKME